MKRLGIAVTLLMIAFSTAANALSNWLVGIEGAYSQRKAILDITIFHPDLDAPPTITSNEMKGNGLLWGLLAGYQTKCDSWLLGFELNIEWENIDNQQAVTFTDILNQTWGGTAQYKRNTIWGFSTRLGYEVTSDFLPFVRLGVQTSRDTLRFALATNPLTLADLGEGNRRTFRYVLGAGAEFPIPALKSLKLRTEYNFYSKGPSVEAVGLASDLGTLLILDSRPKSHVLKASLVKDFL